MKSAKGLAGSIILLFCIVLAGCGRPTAYVKADPLWGTGYGYSEKRMAADEFSVVAAGNRSTVGRRVAEIALLRAARLTKEEGRTHFVIIKEKTEALESVKVISFPLMIGSIAVPVIVRERTVKEPLAVLLIRLLPLLPAYPADALDADEVIEVLAARLD